VTDNAEEGPKEPVSFFQQIGLTELHLLDSFTFSGKIDGAPPEPGWSVQRCIFCLDAEGYGYRLGLFIQDNHLLLQRNDDAAAVLLLDPQGFSFIVRCSATQIDVTVADRFGRRDDRKVTTYCAAPASLRRWAAKKAALGIVRSFPDAASAKREVIVQLMRMAKTLRETGAWVSFWTSEPGKKRKPRAEPDLTSIVMGHIAQTLDLAKNIITVPQAATGSGRMDFMFLARLDDGEPILICCEAKVAHSPDLAHGLEVQLMEYMQLKETSHGIYIVFDFGPDHPPSAKFSARGEELPENINQMGLETCLQIAASERSVVGIVIPVFPADNPSTPLKRRRSNKPKPGPTES
jgi:hypothetical protein